MAQGVMELDFAKFKASMALIRQKYDDMYKCYSSGGNGLSIISGLDLIRRGWNSEYGYVAVNNFGTRIASSMNKGTESIFKCYTRMQTTMQYFAKTERQGLNVPDIGVKNYVFNRKQYSDQKIHIDPNKAKNGADAIGHQYFRIQADIQAMIDQTASDAKFGFKNDGGENPRAAMHDALVAIKDGLDDALRHYKQYHEEHFQEDYDRQQAEQNSASNDFAGYQPPEVEADGE